MYDYKEISNEKRLMKRSLKEDVEYLRKIVKDQYEYEQKQNPRKGSYSMGSRIGKLSTLGEMNNRLEGISERHFTHKKGKLDML